MSQWMLLLLGAVTGILIVAIALTWAFWPRPFNRNSWLPPPTGDAGDPTPGGSS